MNKHKILNPCDILTGNVTVDEFAKQFFDKIAEKVTAAVNLSPSATAISSATILAKATGVSNASNVLPAAMSKRQIKSSSVQGLRLKNGMKSGGEEVYHKLKI